MFEYRRPGKGVEKNVVQESGLEEGKEKQERGERRVEVRRLKVKESTDDQKRESIEKEGHSTKIRIERREGEGEAKRKEEEE